MGNINSTTELSKETLERLYMESTKEGDALFVENRRLREALDKLLNSYRDLGQDRQLFNYDLVREATEALKTPQ